MQRLPWCGTEPDGVSEGGRAPVIPAKVSTSGWAPEAGNPWRSISGVAGTQGHHPFAQLTRWTPAFAGVTGFLATLMPALPSFPRLPSCKRGKAGTQPGMGTCGPPLSRGACPQRTRGWPHLRPFEASDAKHQPQACPSSPATHLETSLQMPRLCQLWILQVRHDHWVLFWL